MLWRRAYPNLVPKEKPTEQYTHRGAKIPIPHKEDFEADLRKIIEAVPPPAKPRKKTEPKPS